MLIGTVTCYSFAQAGHILRNFPTPTKDNTNNENSGEIHQGRQGQEGDQQQTS